MDDNKIPLNEQKAKKSIIGNLIINNVLEKGISAVGLKEFAQNMTTMIEDKNKLIEMKDKEEKSKNTNDGPQK